MSEAIKTSFIERCLKQYNAEVSQGMKQAGARQKVTAGWEKTTSSTVTLAGAGAVSNLSFKEYIRMLDMGVGRKHPLGGLKEEIVSLQAQNKTGSIFKKDNTRKPKKIYSKTAYGKLTTLYNRLLYGYTEETVAMLKQELSQKQNNV